MTEKTREKLFDYMDQEHGVTLLETGMEEIEDIILKNYKKQLIKDCKELMTESPIYIIEKAENNLLKFLIKVIKGKACNLNP